jgi:hypothetical protein
MKKPPLFHSTPYELTEQGRQVYGAQVRELEERRTTLIDEFHTTYGTRAPGIADLTASLKLLQQVDSEIERLDRIMGHSAALDVRNRTPK